MTPREVVQCMLRPRLRVAEHPALAFDGPSRNVLVGQKGGYAPCVHPQWGRQKFCAVA